MRPNTEIGFIINLLCRDLLFRNRVNNARRVISTIFPNLIAFMEILFRTCRDRDMAPYIYTFIFTTYIYLESDLSVEPKLRVLVERIMEKRPVE